MFHYRNGLHATIALLVSMILSGCGGGGSKDGEVLEVWCHQGQESEYVAMQSIADQFNAAHDDSGLHVNLTFFPDNQYTEKISTAAAAGRLPDVMDVDGPTLARFVDAGLVVPLSPYFTKAELADFLPTIMEQGTINSDLYALGAFDSALVLYYDKNMLAEADVDIPAPGETWSWDEFLDACRKLKAKGIDPVAMHMNETADEWYTYAFSPILWSSGGRLISKDGERVLDVLDSEGNVEALKRWQILFAENLAASDPVDPNPFGGGSTAMDWTGHWMARRHEEAKGDALGVMPLPRMGEENAAACGSWCWAITSAAPDPTAAAEWVRWVTDPVRGIKPIVRANGAVPARISALKEFPEYTRQPYALFKQQLATAGRPRPRTPHYATLTRSFASALRDIAHGAEVKTRLQSAAEEIQRTIDRN